MGYVGFVCLAGSLVGIIAWSLVGVANRDSLSRVVVLGRLLSGVAALIGGCYSIYLAAT